MGFLDWLNKTLNPEPPIIMNDPYFGKLKYVSGTNIHGGKFEHWEGELLTPLSPSPLTVFIETDIQGPNVEHRSRMEELIENLPKLQTEICRVLFEQWTEFLNILKSDTDDEWLQMAKQFDKPEKMADLYELGSLEVCNDEKYKYELQYSYRGEIGEFDTTAHFLVIDQNWSVSYSGGAD